MHRHLWSWLWNGWWVGSIHRGLGMFQIHIPKGPGCWSWCPSQWWYSSCLQGKRWWAPGREGWWGPGHCCSRSPPGRWPGPGGGWGWLRHLWGEKRFRIMECSLRKGAQKQTICLEPHNSQTPETPSGEVGKELIVNLSSRSSTVALGFHICFNTNIHVLLSCFIYWVFPHIIFIDKDSLSLICNDLLIAELGKSRTPEGMGHAQAHIQLRWESNDMPNIRPFLPY